MRVVHVASGRLFGGIEQMLVTMARETSLAPDMALTFAVTASGGVGRLGRTSRLNDELRQIGADVLTLGDVRIRRPQSIVKARSVLRGALAACRPDAVVCHAPWAYALFAPVAKRLRLPLVCWQHDRATGRPLVERWAARTRADLVVCNSAWTCQSADLLQPDVPTAVIHPPVAVSPCPAGTRETLRRDLDTSPGDIVILSASRLERWKGHVKLVRALGRLRTTTPWTLWIAGGAQRPHEEQYLARLRREVTALGLEPRVRLLGERRDVPCVMRAVDIFCQPNEGPEPFGVVLAEALLSGLPVVTTDAGGAREIVCDECGRLVPAGDLDALSRTLDDLIEDAPLRARLGNRGPAHAAARCAPAVVLPQVAHAIGRVARQPTP
jgi:glycosyltransferase involved in cell wall biosynthesis